MQELNMIKVDEVGGAGKLAGAALLVVVSLT